MQSPQCCCLGWRELQGSLSHWLGFSLCLAVVAVGPAHVVGCGCCFPQSEGLGRSSCRREVAPDVPGKCCSSLTELAVGLLA